MLLACFQHEPNGKGVRLKDHMSVFRCKAKCQYHTSTMLFFLLLTFINMISAQTPIPGVIQPPQVVSRQMASRGGASVHVAHSDIETLSSQLTQAGLSAETIIAINNIVKQPMQPSAPVSFGVKQSQSKTDQNQQIKQGAASTFRNVGTLSSAIHAQPSPTPHLQINGIEVDADAAAAATTNAAAKILSSIVPTRILKAIFPTTSFACDTQTGANAVLKPSEVENAKNINDAKIIQQAHAGAASNETVHRHADPNHTNVLTSLAASHAAAALQKPERTAEELHAGITCGIETLVTAAASELERRGISQLLKSAVHEHGLVRLEAARALGRLADAKSTAVLLRLAMTDNYIHARKAAIEALRSISRANEGVESQIITALKNVMQATPNPNIGWKTANALAAMGDASVTEYLLSILEKTEDEWIAWEGLVTLEKLPPVESAPRVVFPFLTHPSQRLAEAAFSCISNMSTTSVLAWRAMRACRHHKVQQIATKAIEACHLCPAKSLPEAMLIVAAHQNSLAMKLKKEEIKVVTPNLSRFRSEL